MNVECKTKLEIHMIALRQHGRASNKGEHDARDQTGSGQSQDPAAKDKKKSLPVQGLETTAGAETDGSSGTSNAVGRGDGQTQLGASQDRDRGGHLGRETTGG